ncbi:hypothetical protein [Streptomyces sp. NPDC101249]|uniref:hypothetical protein n=1 Tax=Streptomyces sp. NPDC101249 TaxID=3366140 RepID=UPI0037F3BCC7
MSRRVRGRVPYTAWSVAAVAVAWNPWFIGPGGAVRLQHWAPWALASLALAGTVGAVADYARHRRIAAEDGTR